MEVNQEEKHRHVWVFLRSTFYCDTDDECTLVLSAQVVTKRLSFWIQLEDEDWQRRLMSKKGGKGSGSK